MEVVVEQRVYLRIHDEDDAATPTTIAAIGAAEWLVFFPVYRGAAVAAVTGAGVNHHAVDEADHRRLLPREPRPPRRDARC